MTDAQAVLAKSMTEKELLQTVLEMARARGWEAYHTHDSRRSEAGYPDLTLARNGAIIFAELKSEKGHLTLDQVKWMRAISRAHVWRPSDLLSGAIERALR